MTIEQFINEKILKKSKQFKENSTPFPTYKKTYKKNKIITQFGQIEQNGYFLINGIIESAIEKDGEIRIIDFVFPNNFICSYTSYLLQTTSEIQTKAIADCEVEYFFRKDLIKAYKTSTVANEFDRYVKGQFLISKLKEKTIS